MFDGSVTFSRFRCPRWYIIEHRRGPLNQVDVGQLYWRNEATSGAHLQPLASLPEYY